MKIGSYRPGDTDTELDITVRLPPFWFDDRSGDYESFADGKRGPLERAKLAVPLDTTASSDPFVSLNSVAFASGQCVPAAMGALP